jgi:tetratricopeptide (TPR) repeat protein
MSPIYLLAVSWAVLYRTAPLAGWIANAAPDAPAVAAVDGEMVDGDWPATYRLPPVAPAPTVNDVSSRDAVPLFVPPLPPERSAPTATFYAAPAPQFPIAPAPQVPFDAPSTDPPSPPAGSPPEDGLQFPAPDDEPPAIITAPYGVQAATMPRPRSTQTAPVTAELTAQLLPAVQRGYVLAERGALFAARTEFVQVLRRVAQAKDVAASSAEHSQALAAGLRALDEAEDFVPDGVQLEAELDVETTASAHRTPALEGLPACILPHEAADKYHRYARQQLAMAVAGEQAGSMALYGLGRIDAQLAARREDDLRFVRGAMTMYAAALEACPQNHLAANELGVLECRTGQPAEAVRLFERTIDFAPSATAYHNLAVAQQRLGRHAEAQANEQESQRLAAWERSRGALSRRAGVRWVSPDEMARVAQPALVTPATSADAQPAPKSPWQRTVELARSIPPRGLAAPPPAYPQPTPHTHVVWPAAHPTQHRWR